MLATAVNGSLEDVRLRRQARLAVLRYTRRLPSATVGECYQALLSDQPRLRLLGGSELPSGLRLDADSRELCGIPVHAGRYPIELEELPGGRRWRFELEVIEAARPTIAHLRLPALHVGSALDMPILLESPCVNVIWSVGDGRLPPGLRLQADSGRLHGIPTTPGVWCCSLRAQAGQCSGR